MIYYETTFKGKRLRIPARAYRSLVSRFDVKRIQDCHIEKECSLCLPEWPRCHEGCAFHAIRKYGCMELIVARVGNQTKQILSIGYEDISWQPYDDKEARRRLKRIREELKKFRRVEE